MSASSADTLQIFVAEAADYFLWAVQHFYEPREQAGRLQREDRYLRLFRQQIGEIHDLHFGPERGTFFNAQQPLTLDGRFGEQKRKKP